MAFWPKKDELLHLKFFQRKSNGLHFITHLEWTRQALLREQGETWLPEIASAPPKTKKHPCSRSYHGPLPQISLLQEDSKPKSQVLHFPKRLTTQHFFFFFPRKCLWDKPLSLPVLWSPELQSRQKSSLLQDNLLSFTFIHVFPGSSTPGPPLVDPTPSRAQLFGKSSFLSYSLVLPCKVFPFFLSVLEWRHTL